MYSWRVHHHTDFLHVLLKNNHMIYLSKKREIFHHMGSKQEEYFLFFLVNRSFSMNFKGLDVYVQ